MTVKEITLDKTNVYFLRGPLTSQLDFAKLLGKSGTCQVELGKSLGGGDVIYFGQKAPEGYGSLNSEEMAKVVSAQRGRLMGVRHAEISSIGTQSTIDTIRLHDEPGLSVEQHLETAQEIIANLHPDFLDSHMVLVTMMERSKGSYMRTIARYSKAEGVLQPA